MRKLAVILVLLFAFTMVGCEAHMHNVGKGAQGNDVVELRQWYILFGLVPLNVVDTNDMSEGAADYTIETETSVLDIVMNCFTSTVSVTSRTVTVTK